VDAGGNGGRRVRNHFLPWNPTAAPGKWRCESLARTLSQQPYLSTGLEICQQEWIAFVWLMMVGRWLPALPDWVVFGRKLPQSRVLLPFRRVFRLAAKVCGLAGAFRKPADKVCRLANAFRKPAGRLGLRARLVRRPAGVVRKRVPVVRRRVNVADKPAGVGCRLAGIVRRLSGLVRRLANFVRKPLRIPPPESQ